MRLLLALLFLLPTVALSEVSYDAQTKTMRVVGPTDMSQVVKASNILREKKVNYVEMWGPGGSLEMGLQLGNYFWREGDITVFIPKHRSCISACAFAAMGADTIRVDGKLMLHRPFIPFAPIMEPLESLFGHMGKGYLMVVYYLEDKGYDRNIMRSMLTYTSPCKFMVYEDLLVEEPEDLKMWIVDDSRCQMMMWGIRR